MSLTLDQIALQLPQGSREALAGEMFRAFGTATGEYMAAVGRSDAEIVYACYPTSLSRDRSGTSAEPSWMSISQNTQWRYAAERQGSSQQALMHSAGYELPTAIHNHEKLLSWMQDDEDQQQRSGRSVTLRKLYETSLGVLRLENIFRGGDAPTSTVFDKALIREMIVSSHHAVTADVKSALKLYVDILLTEVQEATWGGPLTNWKYDGALASVFGGADHDAVRTHVRDFIDAEWRSVAPKLTFESDDAYQARLFREDMRLLEKLTNSYVYPESV